MRLTLRNLKLTDKVVELDNIINQFCADDLVSYFIYFIRILLNAVKWIFLIV